MTDIKKIRYRASAELGDGMNSMTLASKRDLVEAVREFCNEFDDPSDAGEAFTVELVAMTDDEFDELPEL